MKNIKLLAVDVDGVLTDAGMYYSENGDELKKFNTRDGMGLSLLQQEGVIVAIVTGENTEIVKRRSKKLNIKEIFQGVKDKKEIIVYLCEKYNINREEVAYIGDDINDLEVMKFVGLGAAVADGMEVIKEHSKYVTSLKGGEGAVREFCEYILENHMTKI
jgi:YrbI family 3-deoxy-D-manno-octulosonate 8-phosphate phosphatase